MDQSNAESVCPTTQCRKKITFVKHGHTMTVVHEAKIPLVNKITTENVQMQNENFSEHLHPASALTIETISTNICQHCAKFFPKKYNLMRHEKSCRNRLAQPSEKSQKPVDQSCICPKCHVQLTSSNNFIKHKRICKGTCNEAKYKKCPVPDCSVYFYKRTELMKHLQKKHFQNIDMETLKFDSEEKFQEFKNEQNIKSSLACVKHNGNSSGKECTYSYYGCNFNDKKYRNSKFKVPRYPCPARMMVKKYKNGVCEVKLIKHHIHSIEEENLKSFKYPREITKKIKLRLAKGVSPIEICGELFPINRGNKNPMEDHSIALEKIREIQESIIRKKQSRKKPKSQVSNISKVDCVLEETDCVMKEEELELPSSMHADLSSCQTDANQTLIEEIEVILEKLRVDIRCEAVQKTCLPYIHQILAGLENDVDTVKAGKILTQLLA